MENNNKWDAFVDISRDNGLTWNQSEMVPLDHSSFDGKGIFQPSIWESRPNHVHMLLRTTCGRICRSDSTDGGRTWKPAKALSLPNNSSGIDVTKLYDGTLALVYNRVSQNGASRSPLTIALSKDNGKTWPHRLDIETGKGEFSYPSIIPTGIGMAIVYTYKRQRIKFWQGSIERILSDYSLDRLKDEIYDGVKVL
jgi:predicted neuraminidase